MGRIAGLSLLRAKFDPAEASMVMYDPHPLIIQPMSLLFPKTRTESLQLLFLFNKGFEKLKDSGLYEQYMNDLVSGFYDKASE
ncbi:hypothetical protein [Hahella sp. CCB-MM4]|uniref:hypothetical protein n=1 Tax=Hahella sp. (strain CCB-MM4) TaxID=1926491 RepID=UPI00352A41E0